MRSKGPRYDMAGRLPALQSFLLLPIAYLPVASGGQIARTTIVSPIAYWLLAIASGGQIARAAGSEL